MIDMRHPGVYIEEKAGPRPIERVGTSTAGFVGRAPDTTAEIDVARLITNPTQFNNVFNPADAPDNDLSRAVQGFFLNGGTTCFVVNLGPDAPIKGPEGSRKGLDVLGAVDEVAIVAAPGFTDLAAYDALIQHCEHLKDRVAILDPPRDVTDPARFIEVDTGDEPPKTRAQADAGPGDTATTASSARRGPVFATRSNYATAYFPWLVVQDWRTGKTVEVPPSGHMAGIWARTDATRGVHKAPANEPVRGAIDLTYRVIDAEQDLLNPIGVNCIRTFPAEGIKVWGARTLASDAQWRYLSVRRLFNMIEESIMDGTRWVVFEPNDRTLWKSIRRDVGAFLTSLWRDGALMGRTPEEAFFVKCDEETNPSDVVDEGKVVIVVGISPTKPAEFVHFLISQTDGGPSRSGAGV
jgi:uncharacterized protein